MRAEDRIFRSGDGSLVGVGDPAAAFLAYAPGDEVTAADQAAVKALSAPADKARTPGADKSAAAAAGRRGRPETRKTTGD